MGSIDNRLEKTKKARRIILIKNKTNDTNQCVLDVHHVWLAMYFQRGHNKYWISNRYNWHIQHENLEIKRFFYK